MEETQSRPSESTIKAVYDRFLNSGTSLSKLRDDALAGRLFIGGNVIETAGRSLAWKLFLASEEPLQSSSTLRPTALLDSLRMSRKSYAGLLLEHMRAPDGSYEESFILPSSSVSPNRTSKEKWSLETNNPLSLHSENPWREWFASVDLRKTILQDVERTFPDILFFRRPEIQFQLTNILFLYSVRKPSIGYRQGMHELLAPLYYALDYDSISQDGDSTIDDPRCREICSRTWVAADAWALFESVMLGICRWYEWRESPSDQISSAFSPFATHVQLNIPDGKSTIKPYIPPIVDACNRIQSTLLRTTDPLLWKHMQDAGIEPQLYGIRWLRLLFTREFIMSDAMKLWDGLFACDPSLDLAQWICVAMLIRIRNELIPADYSGQLTVLLRYPTRTALDYDGAPHPATLLLRQALALQMSPTPSTGASLVIENRNLLGIPIEVPDSHPTRERTRGRQGGQKSTSFSSGRTSIMDSIHGSSGQPSHQMGLAEMIARGLLERGESLGINKTLMSAVSDLRRNIPDLAASLVRSPSSPSYSTFPLSDERPPEERPPWEPRTRFDVERDVLELRSTNKRLGQSLSWIVDALLQDEDETLDRPRLQKQKREALESLSYIRDVLIGSVSEIDEQMLLSEEESTRRKHDSENGMSRPNIRYTGISTPIPPPPASVSDSRANSRNFRSHSASHLPITYPKTSIPASSGITRAAPWNHTSSSFSSTNVPSLPRLPPPTSTSVMGPKPGEQKAVRREIDYDPLGVIE